MFLNLTLCIAQSAGAVEYTDYERPGCDTKQSNGEFPEMLGVWGMWGAPSLLSLPGPLWPGVVAPDRALSMGQIEVICVLTLN